MSDPAPRDARGRRSAALSDLFAEAERQLSICNSCRYCEGYCAVYPALEQRTVLSATDIVYLSRLCHDCRACLYACMYAPPHEFAVNPPAVFAAVRRETARAFLPRALADLMPRWMLGAVAGAVAVVATLVGALATRGVGPLAGTTGVGGSPYDVIPYAVILALAFACFAGAACVFAFGIAAYVRATGGAWRRGVRAWVQAVRDAATLRNMRGGEEGCYVIPDTPTVWRRLWHAGVAYGFSLCLLATIAAAVEQDIVGVAPPYPYASVPVLAGLVGGVLLVAGSIGLAVTMRSQDFLGVDEGLVRRDGMLLAALGALGLSGCAVLFCRSTGAYGAVLALHLTLVWSCVLLAPVSKIVHAAYRLLALVQEREEAPTVPG